MFDCRRVSDMGVVSDKESLKIENDSFLKACLILGIPSRHHMGFNTKSWNMGTPKSSIYRWFFHYKQSILGHHHLWNPPYRYCSSVSFCHSVPIHPVKPRSISTRNWGEERQRPHRHQHVGVFGRFSVAPRLMNITYTYIYITINDNSELFMFVFAWEQQIIAFVSSGVRLVRGFLNTRHWKLPWRRSAGQHLATAESLQASQIVINFRRLRAISE